MADLDRYPMKTAKKTFNNKEKKTVATLFTVF